MYIYMLLCASIKGLVSIFHYYVDNRDIFLVIFVPFVIAYIQAFEHRQIIRIFLVVALMTILLSIYIIGVFQSDTVVDNIATDICFDDETTTPNNSSVPYSSLPPINEWNDTLTPAPNDKTDITQFSAEQEAFSNWYYGLASIEDMNIIIAYINQEISHDSAGAYGTLTYLANDMNHYFYRQDSSNIYDLINLIKQTMQVNIDLNHCGPYNISFFWNGEYIIQLSMQYLYGVYDPAYSNDSLFDNNGQQIVNDTVYF